MADKTQSLADRINDALPQTFCRQCGFAGCREYAEAVAAGLAPINRCPPGGDEGIHALSLITHQLYLPLDPEYGRELPFAVARIRGDECIGCGRCRKVCPVDAITGGPKRLHAVIEDACTGCSLCQAACPIACISMVETGAEWTPERRLPPQTVIRPASPALRENPWNRKPATRLWVRGISPARRRLSKPSSRLPPKNKFHPNSGGAFT